MGLLTALVLTPLFGAILLLMIPEEFHKAIKGIAWISATVTFLLSLGVLSQFNPHDFHFQLLESKNWIPSLGVKYLVGVDGISLWMLVLTALLGIIAVAVSQYETSKVKSYFFLLLLLETSLLGTFVSLDMILFYCFFELSIFPIAFLIWLWGDEDRNRAALRTFIYLFGGSIFMLLGMIFLALQQQKVGGAISFSILDIQSSVAHGNFWVGAEMAEPVVFWAFALAFLIKSPAFPFHTWLVDSYTQAPIGAVLLGAIVKTGTYGLVRFCLVLFPDVLPHAAPVILTLATIGVIYGGVLAAGQTDLKRLIAFSSVAHVGFILLGIFSMTYTGLIGGVLGMFNHGIATGALFLLIGFLYWRYRSKTLDDFGGLKRQMPAFATLFMFAMVAAIGLPGTNDFVSEFLSLFGAFEAGVSRIYNISLIFAIISASGVILAAVYMLIFTKKILYGPLKNHQLEKLKDLKHWEVAIVSVLIIFIFWGGIVPSTFTDSMETSTEATAMMAINPADQRPVWLNEHHQIDAKGNLETDEFGAPVTLSKDVFNPSFDFKGSGPGDNAATPTVSMNDQKSGGAN